MAPSSFRWTYCLLATWSEELVLLQVEVERATRTAVTPVVWAVTITQPKINHTDRNRSAQPYHARGPV